MTAAKVAKRELSVFSILFAGIILPMFWISGEVTSYKTVTVATYNIWNIMFQWDVRKYRIAEMVSANTLSDLVNMAFCCFRNK